MDLMILAAIFAICILTVVISIWIIANTVNAKKVDVSVELWPHVKVHIYIEH